MEIPRFGAVAIEEARYGDVAQIACELTEFQDTTCRISVIAHVDTPGFPAGG
jgi:hypothetical protein